MTWNLFSPKPCLVCAEKDVLSAQLRGDLSRAQLRLSILEERLAKATDLLLAKAGTPALTPPVKFTAKDAEDLMKESFAFFRDLDDDGSGRIREADQLEHDQRGPT